MAGDSVVIWAVCWNLLLLAAPGLATLTSNEIQAFTNQGACAGAVDVSDIGDSYVITSNGLPDHTWTCTGSTLPEAQDYTFNVPKSPQPSEPTCLPAGIIGVAKNGVPFLSAALDGHSVVEGETASKVDDCGGFTGDDGKYYYVRLPSGGGCTNPIYDASQAESKQFLGVALDGYPIYSEWSDLPWQDLDECRGTTLEDGSYVYVARKYFPYLFSCFRGTPVEQEQQTALCGPGGYSLYLCECVGDSAEWQTYCDITCDRAECVRSCPATRRSHEDSPLERILRRWFSSTGDRTKRSPRLNFHQRDVMACHDDSDPAFTDGACDASAVTRQVRDLETREEYKKPEYHYRHGQGGPNQSRQATGEHDTKTADTSQVSYHKTDDDDDDVRSQSYHDAEKSPHADRYVQDSAQYQTQRDEHEVQGHVKKPDKDNHGEGHKTGHTGDGQEQYETNSEDDGSQSRGYVRGVVSRGQPDVEESGISEREEVETLRKLVEEIASLGRRRVGVA